MTVQDQGCLWFARLQHDLVKRLLWVARDCREFERQPSPGELIATFYDEDGAPIDALSLFARFREDAPTGLDLDAFGAALGACVTSAQDDDLAGVLALEAAFERFREGESEGRTELAPSLKEKTP